MARIVNVCLSERTYAIPCDPGEVEDLAANDFCIVDLPEGGEAVGFVKGYEFRCDIQMKDRELPKVLRRATSRDVRGWHFLKRREAEAIAQCKEKVAKHNLDMKISSVVFDDNQRKITFHFTADKRVDFRELVKDLANSFRARIELWQIGVRDEAKKHGGIGMCGCHLCCSAWMKDFAPVSIRCAKTQDIPFSPTKLSGSCGRLRCCLAYEQQQYVELAKGVPHIGSMVETIHYGKAKVVDRNLLRRQLSIVDEADHLYTIPLTEVKGIETEVDEEEAVALDPEEEREAASLMIEERSEAPSPSRKERPSRDRRENRDRRQSRPPDRGQGGPDRPRRAPEPPPRAARLEVKPQDLSDETEEETAGVSAGAGGEDTRSESKSRRRRGKRGGRNRNKNRQDAAAGTPAEARPAPNGEGRPRQDRRPPRGPRRPQEQARSDKN